MLQNSLAYILCDAKHSEQKELVFTLGSDVGGVSLAVVHTFDESTTASISMRLISARSATQRERQFYEDETRQVMQ